MQQTRHRKLRLLGYVVGGLVLLLLVGLLLIQTGPVRRYALRQVEQTLAQQNIHLEARSLRYSLVRGWVRLDGLVIRSTEAPDLPALARIERVEAHISLWQAVLGRYRLRDVILQEPAIHIFVDQQGRDNLPRLPAPEHPLEEQDDPVDYLIHDLRASAGSLRYDDREQDVALALPVWELAIDGDQLTKAHELRLRAPQPGRALYQGRALPLAGISVDAVLHPDAFEVRELDLRAAGSHIAASGLVDDLDAPSLDLTLQADLLLAPLAQFAGVEQEVAGRLQARLAATGPLPEARVSAEVTGTDLRFEQFDRMQLTAQAEFDRAVERLRLPQLALQSPAASVQGEADIVLQSGAGESTLSAHITRLDLERLTALLQQPVGIASRAAGTLSARWPDVDVERAIGQADFQLTATRQTPGEGILPLAGQVRASATEQRIVLGLRNVHALGAEAQGQVEVRDRRRLEGAVEARVADLDVMLRHLQAFTGEEEPLLPTAVSGPVTVSAQLGGTTEQPRAQVEVAAPALQVGELSDVSLRAQALYTPQQLALPSVEVRWREQSLAVQGTVALVEPSPALDLAARIDNFHLGTALAALGREEIPAEGVASATATIGGTVARPAVDVALSAEGLTAYGEPLGTLEVRAQLAEQLLRLTQFRLEKPEGAGELVAEGSLHFDTRAYQLRAQARSLEFRELQLEDGTLVRGRVNLSAQGQGTLDDPTLRATLNVDELLVGEAEVGQVNARLDVAAGQAKLEAGAPRYDLRVAAHVGIEAPHPADIHITAEGTDLALLPMPPEQELEGTLSAVVEARGELDRWEQGAAEARVTELRATLNQQPLRNEGPLVVAYADRAVQVHQLTLLSTGSRIQAQGRLALDDAAAAPSDLRLQGTFDLAALAGFLPEEDINARGTLNLEAAVAGTLRRLDPTADLTLSDGYIFAPQLEPAITDLELQAQVRAGQLAVQRLAARWAGADIQASAEAPLRLFAEDLPLAAPAQPGPARAQLRVTGLDLGAVGAVPEEVGGAISLRSTFEAPRLELAAATGSLVFDELRLQLAGVPVEQQAPATLTLAEGVLRIEPMLLTGPETRFQLAGTAGLVEPRPLDVRLEGMMDAAVLAAFLEGATARGETRLEFAATGTADDPDLRGFLTMEDADFGLQRPLVAVEDLDLRVDLAADQVTLTRLSGLLNGGRMTGGGSLRFARGDLQDVNLRLAAENVFMDFPEGLRTLSDLDLSLRSQNEFLVLAGGVRVQEGGYTEPIRLEREFFRYLRQGETVDLTEERSPMLERLRFNIAMTTVAPLIVDNNLAQAAIEADLTVLGNVYRPGVTGRVTLEEGGELHLGDQTYILERGVITFVDERRIEPMLDILAQTQTGGYDIMLNISGEVGDIETTLTSDPELPEPDIVALLVLGRTLEEVRGAEFEVAQEQMLSLLSGQVTGQLARQLEGITGLSMVRIDPAFVSAEENPGARLTVGEDITRDLSLIYSINLADPRDQMYIAEYDITRRFTTTGVRQPDNSYRFEFRHDLRFGGVPRVPVVRPRREVGTVNFRGDLFFEPRQLERQFRLRPGRQYDFFRARQGLERLDRLYADQDRLETRIQLDRDPRNGAVDLTLNIEAGPRVEFIYEGWTPPRRLVNEVRALWRRGVIDVQRASEANRAIRNALVRLGHLESEVEHELAEHEDLKRVVFNIRPGPRYRDIEVLFPGAEGLQPARLRELLRDQDLEEELHTEPDQVTVFLRRYYREFGYLDAEVEDRRYEFDRPAQTARLIIAVDEGPLYRVGRVEFLRAAAFSEEQLRAAAQLTPGSVYRPDQREEAFDRVQDLYWNEGYTNVDITSILAPNPDEGVVDIVFTIEEGLQRVVQEVHIAGLEYTSDGMVRSQLQMDPGVVLSHELLSGARRRLYRTGAYALVDIQIDEADPATALEAHQRPVRVAVNLREVQPYRLRYGAFFDTERGLGGIADFSSRNVIGNARLLGVRTRYDAQLREGRLYFSQPQLSRFPLRTDSVIFAQRDARDAFTTDRLGFTLNQETRFWEHYIWNFGYRIEQTRTFEVVEPLLAQSIRVAPFTTAFSRETRNDVLDATRGSFQAHAFEYAPSWAGSQLRYYKYFGQFFRYVGLTRPTEVPFVRGLERSRVVFAGGLRVGLAGGLEGQELIPPDRFFAGGGNTIRGFEQDSVGPTDALGNPIGGDSVFIFNAEMRFPLLWIFDGVSFLDLGNVYPRASDFRPWDVRKGGGFGLRVRTPYFLLRADYGWKLDRRPGEAPGRFFFSIGQAF